MDEKHLLILSVLVGVVTLIAVLGTADGTISVEDTKVAGAFTAGAAIAWLIATGRRPKL